MRREGVNAPLSSIPCLVRSGASADGLTFVDKGHPRASDETCFRTDGTVPKRCFRRRLLVDAGRERRSRFGKRGRGTTTFATGNDHERNDHLPIKDLDLAV